MGAIIRTAECAGAHGVIVQERRAVGLTPAAVKASAGAVEYLPVARVTNLTTALLELKAQNIWTFAADMEHNIEKMLEDACTKANPITVNRRNLRGLLESALGN